MVKIVLDSSVLVKWITSKDEKLVKEARKILHLLQKERVKVFVPELARFEIGNALWKKDIVFSEAAFDLDLFYDFPIEFVGWDSGLAKDCLKVAIQEKITYYDATFISLAIKLKAVLITDNPKHQNPRFTDIKIVSLKDY